MTKVLVTGGTGFIGSHTVVELLQKNYDVVIIDDLSNSSADVLDSIEKIAGVKPEFEQFDLCDKNKLKDFFSRHKDIKAVIHFAAKKAVGESVDNPLLYYRNNLFSFVNLLECMLENAIKFIVFSSSCTVYGEPDYLPVDEHAPIKKAASPYGNTKQICEEILEETISANNEKLEGIALRYFNPTGAHESALIGELPIGIPNNLIPFVTQTAIGKRDKLKVFGGDYETEDGSCIRDFIHVVDLAKAHIIALERMTNLKIQSPYEVFNLGTGVGYSVLDVVKTFENVSGVKLNYEVVGRRDGDIMQMYADTNLANNELGWKAERGLEQMLETAWKWELALKEKSK